MSGPRRRASGEAEGVVSASEQLRAEVERAIQQAGGDFVPALIAEKVISNCDAAVLDAWLHERAPYFLTAEISSWLRSERSRAHHHAKAVAFGQAVEEGSVSEFSVVYEVDEDHTRRRVADMTAADHRFVAAAYHRSARTDLMLAAFHKAVAKKIGRRKTSEALTEEQYVRLMRSISGEPDHKAA